MNPLYLYYVTNVKKAWQIVFSSIAFVLWVLVIGEHSIPYSDSLQNISVPSYWSFILFLFRLSIKARVSNILMI